MKKFINVAGGGGFALLLLTGCGDSVKSVEYYQNNIEAIKATCIDCNVQLFPKWDKKAKEDPVLNEQLEADMKLFALTGSTHLLPPEIANCALANVAFELLSYEQQQNIRQEVQKATEKAAQ